MKSIFKTICIFCLIIIIGCNRKPNRSNDQKVVNSKEDIQTIKGISSDDKLNNVGTKLTHDQLYSEGETRREVSTRLGAAPSTMKKLYSERLGNDSLSIKLSYQKNRIIAVVYRITNSRDENIAYSVFYFDENNICITNTKRNKGEHMSYDYAMYYGSLIKCDVNYNQIEIDSLQRQQIIQSAKSSLDSIMQHFPEFKYSFNWK
jgi:hypothetical protein